MSSTGFNYRSLNGCYDVFLSFRGEDTRRGFTLHLHEALCRQGIKTFIDFQLMKGETIDQIFPTIERSKIAVVVFSENYGSSSWCLKELEKIMICRRKGEQVVLPIFYMVDPSELRSQRGKTAGYLAQHMDNYWGSVDNWRAAIKEFANLVGWHYKANDSCRTEARLIEEVVNEISATLERKRAEEWPPRAPSRDHVTDDMARSQDVYFTEETSYLNQGPAIKSRNAGKLHIFVIALFRPYPKSLQVDPGATIGDVKVEVREMLGLEIPVAKQRLYFSGEELQDDDRNLACYNIPNEATLCTFK